MRVTTLGEGRDRDGDRDRIGTYLFGRRSLAVFSGYLLTHHLPWNRVSVKGQTIPSTLLANPLVS